jgi:hypothetical protein
VSRRLSWVWRPVGIYAASRLVVGVAVAVADDLLPLPGIPSLRTWDHGWYLAVARDGYPSFVPELSGQVVQSNLAFFPLFPLLVRLIHYVGFSWDMASIVAAALTGLAAVLMLWRLLAATSGPRDADRGTALFCFFPGSFVLSLGYAEGLMVALSCGCLLALLRRRWLIAGSLAGLATATRANAVALVAACVWAALMAVRSRREWRALIAPVLAPAGALGFFAYLWVHTDQAGAYLRAQQGWGQRIKPTATWDILSAFFERPFFDTNVTVVVAGTAFLLVGAWALVRSRPPGVVVAYTIGVMAVALLTPVMGARPRYLLTAFPLVTALGRTLSPLGFTMTLGSFATLLGCFTVLTLTSHLATP